MTSSKRVWFAPLALVGAVACGGAGNENTASADDAITAGTSCQGHDAYYCTATLQCGANGLWTARHTDPLPCLEGPGGYDLRR